MIPSFTLKNLLSAYSTISPHSHLCFSTLSAPTQECPFIFFIPPLKTKTSSLSSVPFAIIRPTPPGTNTNIFWESCLSTALLKILTCIHIGTWNMWAIKVLESLVYNLTTALYKWLHYVPNFSCKNWSQYFVPFFDWIHANIKWWHRLKSSELCKGYTKIQSSTVAHRLSSDYKFWRKPEVHFQHKENARLE